MYSTHIVAPGTPNSYGVMRDKPRMSSPNAPYSGVARVNHRSCCDTRPEVPGDCGVATGIDAGRGSFGEERVRTVSGRARLEREQKAHSVAASLM